mgnify:CR=1 FL=1
MKRNHPKKKTGAPKAAPYDPSEVTFSVGGKPIGGFVDTESSPPKHNLKAEVSKAEEHLLAFLTSRGALPAPYDPEQATRVLLNTYTLDVSKWRCGIDGDQALGFGFTCMLNKNGYSCCLGQFAQQKGVSSALMSGLAYPYRIGYQYDTRFVSEHLGNTTLASDLAAVNDNIHTTPAEKVAKIRGLLAMTGAELVVIDPDNILGGA